MSRTDSESPVPAVARVDYKDLCLDVTDGPAAARFWAPTLGLTVEADGHGGSQVLRGAAPEHTVWLNVVPEPHTVKNRVHLDVHVPSLAEVIGRGATVLDDTQPWTVLADPEGAEFCAFVRSPDRLPDYRLYELVVDAAEPARPGPLVG